MKQNESNQSTLDGPPQSRDTGYVTPLLTTPAYKLQRQILVLHVTVGVVGCFRFYHRKASSNLSLYQYYHGLHNTAESVAEFHCSKVIIDKFLYRLYFCTSMLTKVQFISLSNQLRTLSGENHYELQPDIADSETKFVSYLHTYRAIHDCHYYQSSIY